MVFNMQKKILFPDIVYFMIVIFGVGLFQDSFYCKFFAGDFSVSEIEFKLVVLK